MTPDQSLTEVLVIDKFGRDMLLKEKAGSDRLLANRSWTSANICHPYGNKIMCRNQSVVFILMVGLVLIFMQAQGWNHENQGLL